MLADEVLGEVFLDDFLVAEVLLADEELEIKETSFSASLFRVC